MVLSALCILSSASAYAQERRTMTCFGRAKTALLGLLLLSNPTPVTGITLSKPCLGVICPRVYSHQAATVLNRKNNNNNTTQDRDEQTIEIAFRRLCDEFKQYSPECLEEFRDYRNSIHEGGPARDNTLAEQCYRSSKSKRTLDN